MLETAPDLAELLARAQKLIEQSKDAEALPILVDLMKHDPGSFKVLESTCELLLRADRHGEAATLALEFATRCPDVAEAQILCAGILIVQNRWAEAAFLEEKAHASGAVKEACLLAYAEIARQSGQYQMHLDLVERLANAVSADRELAFYKFAQICLQYQELERASSVLEVLGEDSKYGRRLAAALDAIHGRGDALANRIEGWLAAPGAGPGLVSEIEQVWSNTDEPRVFDLFRNSVHRWIDDPAVAAAALNYHFARLDGSQDRGTPAISAVTMTPDNYLWLAEALIDHHQPARAKAVMDAFIENKDRSAMVRRAVLYELADGLPCDQDLSRPIVCDDPMREVIVSEPGEPGKLVVVFTGLNGRPLVGVQTLDRALSGLGYQAIYLRDFRRLGYFCGIRSIAPNLPDTLGWLRDKMAEAGAVYPVFLGCSIGSYAAASYGLELGIRRMAMFGFHDRLDSFSRWRIGNSRAPVLMARQKLAALGAIEPMRSRIERATHEFSMKIIYGENNSVDCFYVRRLQGMSGVHPFELKDWNAHDTLSPLLSRGQLRQYLE